MNRFRGRRKKRQQEIAKSKTEPLTADDVSKARLKRHIAIALERAHRQSSAPVSGFSILDIGCGRGTTVAALRREGWNGFGAEIDPLQADLARSGMSAVGYDPALILDISESGSIASKDGRFDFVLSEQVVEHVEDIDEFVSETWRVLKPGGAAFHVFPSRSRIVEPHIGQPFVHWLPKGGPQGRAIRMWVAVGVDAGFPHLQGLSPSDRARGYTAYLRDNTHYRPHRSIENAFLERFDSLDSDVIGDTVAEIPGLAIPMRLGPVRYLVQGLCKSLYGSALFLTRD